MIGQGLRQFIICNDTLCYLAVEYMTIFSPQFAASELRNNWRAMAMQKLRKNFAVWNKIRPLLTPWRSNVSLENLMVPSNAATSKSIPYSLVALSSRTSYACRPCCQVYSCLLISLPMPSSSRKAERCVPRMYSRRQLWRLSMSVRKVGSERVCYIEIMTSIFDTST